MTSTHDLQVATLLEWLDKNAYWQLSLVIKPSKMGGLGVFQERDSNSTDDSSDNDHLLLRIPKSNILAAKNSMIYNLLVDYVPKNPNVDLQKGMFSLVLAVIYEISFKERSPWYGYLRSIDFVLLAVPLCLWDKSDRDNFGNTEVDLRNLLSHDELFEFYVEAVCFAKHFADLVPVPYVLDIADDQVSISIVLQKYKRCLMDFGKVMQAVVSRLFDIDTYYELALVPGADLFNHIEPGWDALASKMIPRENIHFVCDSQVCRSCGEEEEDCEHSGGESSDDGGSDDEEKADGDSSPGSSVDTIEEESEEDEERLGLHSELGDNVNLTDNESDQEDRITEITTEYITKIEQDMNDGSDAETDEDEEESSTVSMDDAEGDATFSGENEDLAKELSDSSKCCDIVLVLDPSPDYGYEIFNSYGYEPNAYLLHRYGFTASRNVNDSCLLSVQLFRYLNDLKSRLSKEKVEQMDIKLNWLEESGFDAINEIVCNSSSCCPGDSGNHENDHDDGEGAKAHDHEEHESEFGEAPELWPLAPRVTFSGKCSPQTYAILSLIEMPYKLFKLKLSSAKNGRQVVKAVKENLVSPTIPTKKFDALIKQWCKARLERYPSLQPSPNYNAIKSLVDHEKMILNKFIANH